MAVDSFSTVTLMEGPLRRVNVARNTMSEYVKLLFGKVE